MVYTGLYEQTQRVPIPPQRLLPVHRVARFCRLLKHCQWRRRSLTHKARKFVSSKKCCSKEKAARESAEERARRLEQGVSPRPVTSVQEVNEIPVEDKALSPIPQKSVDEELEQSSKELEKESAIATRPHDGRHATDEKGHGEIPSSSRDS